MVADLLEPNHGPQIGSSARRNRDGSPPVKAGYWEAAARRLQKACKTSVFSPGRKKEKTFSKQTKNVQTTKKGRSNMAKYQNLVAIRPTTYRRFQSFYEKMPEPKASRTLIISQLVEIWLTNQGAAADPSFCDPDQLDLFNDVK